MCFCFEFSVVGPGTTTTIKVIDDITQLACDMTCITNENEHCYFNLLFSNSMSKLYLSI